MNYCISTSTGSLPLQVVVPITGVLTVQDQGGNTYYATTSCGYSNIVSQYQTVDNPNLDYFFGVALFFALCFTVVFVFKRR